jgi:hypothetical protein
MGVYQEYAGTFRWRLSLNQDGLLSQKAMRIATSKKLARAKQLYQNTHVIPTEAAVKTLKFVSQSVDCTVYQVEH